MRVVPLPPNAELEKMLQGLVQREVRLKPAETPPHTPVAVGLYRTDQPVQELAVLFELPLAGSLAASLTLVPPGAVKEDVEKGMLEESLRENLAEVMNVLSRFVSMSGRRFGLVKHWCPPEVPDPAVVKAALESDETRVVTVEVPGYLGGVMAFDTL
ncbi:MAG TPA: hypothetical protein VEB43_04850 [Anaeromyxobacter sp.]|nr:hypothetical protein [Anaeromyxobacter sp.]